MAVEDLVKSEVVETGAATPLRDWAGQSTANLTRAMLAIAYSHATLDANYASETWRQTSRQAVADWLAGLGYETEA